MWAYTALLLSASLVAPEQPPARPPAPPPFPDLSDPKAAAFSLATALTEGDAKAARAAYAGKQELFLEYLDAVGRTRAKADGLQRAINARYGAGLWGTIGYSLNVEHPIARDDGTKTPLSIAVAVAEVKQRGDEATLKLNKDLTIRLRKSEAGWRVIDFPEPSPRAFLTFQMADQFLDRLTAEVESGKHKKPYELAAAAWRLRVRGGGRGEGVAQGGGEEGRQKRFIRLKRTWFRGPPRSAR